MPDPSPPSARVDQWLWSIRLVKTRAAAAELCRSGHVKVNGRSAKPSTPVAAGDRVEARIHRRDRVVEVVEPIRKRVGAAVAADCFADHTPPAVEPEFDVPVFRRERGTGRPTKRDRRQLDRLRGRPRER